MTRRFLLIFVALTTTTAACGGGDSSAPADAGVQSPQSFAAEVASSDLYVGTPQDVQVGMFFADEQEGVQLVTFGSIEVAFEYLGSGGGDQPEPGPVVTADYLPAPTTPEGGDQVSLSPPAEARGVYNAPDVTFDQAGIWQAKLKADVRGVGEATATTAFQVFDEPQLPAPGQPALRTKNLTMGDLGDAPPEAIDSRAIDGGKVPDPGLHQWTIARAIERKVPALVLFSTPVYCASRFCGPMNESLEAIERKYADRAVFIHVEIWRDYQNSVVNKAAAEWLYRNDNLIEPWLFLIGSDGVIQERWAPLFDPNELEAMLQDLPAGEVPPS
jgi:hypothetical protein